MNKRWSIGLIVIVVFSLVLGGCQNQPTVEEIVAKMQEVEASIENAHAVVDFSMQAEGEDLEATVEMWEKSPNKFRAEVLEANNDELAGVVSVTDGEQVWIYNPGLDEAVVGRVGEFGVDEPLNPRQVIELMQEGIQQIQDTCDVELVGEEDVDGVATYKLEFTPKEGEESPLPIPIDGKGNLWVEQERWIVLQAHLDGGSLIQGRLHVRSFEFNMGVDDERFRFEVPAEAHVINVEDLQPRPLTLDEARGEAAFPLLVPAYLPADATLIDVFTVNDAYVLHYDHSLVSFTVMQRPSDDGEESAQDLFDQRTLQGAEKLDVTVRGQAATLFTDGLENSLLTWTEDGVEFAIAGQISQEEVLKVAESLE